MNKFDLPTGEAVTVHFNGQSLKGEVVDHRRFGTTERQVIVEFTFGPTTYYQPFSRKTGKFFGACPDPRLKAAFLTI